MTILYWDCFSGIAGNMAVASLLDLGADRNKLLKGLNSMDFSEGPIRLIIEERLVNGIRGLYFNTLDDHRADQHNDHHHPDSEDYAEHAHFPGELHDHQMKHGDHHHDNNHDHSHDRHSHCHNGSDHKHDETHHHHPHAPHRGLREICVLIDRANISENAREIAINCFKALAEAEATIHGKSIEEVHFHEVGARDSIADIVGTAICLDDLNITEIRVSPVHLGSGFVKCAHGTMPVPAPATALLLKGYSVVFDHDVSFELTTPTGAAILKGTGARNADGPQMFTRVGHGHGSKDTGRANFLRAFLTESEMQKKNDLVTMLVTNIDNSTGEELGQAITDLMSAGALDVCLVPVLMKKGRPGNQLQVIAPVEIASALEKMIFETLPTLGIRRSIIERSLLARESIIVDSEFGSVRAKKITLPDGSQRIEPEFAELNRIAGEQRSTPRKIKQRIVV